MPVKHIHNLDEFNALLATPGLVVVDFTASWCGPCKFIAPKYEELSNEVGTVTFAKVDVDEAEDVAQSQGIQAMPTFKFFKDGKLVADMMGADFNKLIALVEEHK